MENNKKIELAPAICTQCGASLQVDPNLEAAVCKYCNTPFIIEKAINNYNVRYANIEHADNVNVDLRGSVKEVLDFADRQFKESRADKKEMKKIEAEKDRLFITSFFKMFFIFAGIIIVLWFILSALGLIN